MARSVAKPLTALELSKLKPDSKKNTYRFVGDGLYVEISRKGGKWWRFKYRINGRNRLMSIGTFPEVSLGEAKEKRDACRKLVAAGIDPQLHAESIERERAAKEFNTVAAMAEAWYAKKLGKWAANSAQKARFYLDRDLLPALGHRPISDVRRAELVAVLAGIEKRGAFDVAKKARGWLSGIFRFALVSGVIEINPATDLHIVAAPRPKTRSYPHLPEAELPAFLNALDGYGGDPKTIVAIKLLLMTAVRPGELRAAQWNEFDLDARRWDIPGERMKMRRDHVVPLPTQAVALLSQLRDIGTGRGYVFASSSDRQIFMSENTVNNALARIGYKGRQTGHGFRHLVSTALNERNYNRDWIEMQLSHGDPNGIRGTYNKAQYLDQRRTMMQEWADYLAGL